jgi:hypothetical protein
MLLDSIRQQITVRSFWLGLANPDLPHAEVRSRAAAELAAEHKAARARRAGHAAARMRMASHPIGPQHPQHGDPIARQFISKVMAVFHRLQHEPAGNTVVRRRLRETPPTPPTEPSLAQRIAEAIAPAPEPPAPQAPAVISPNSSSGVQLITDHPVNTGIGDIVTANWRKSIADNARDYEAKRGGKSNVIYIG